MDGGMGTTAWMVAWEPLHPQAVAKKEAGL